MGLLDDTTQNAYYQGGDKGGYQFTSLEDIVNYFMVIYVGEGKTVSKVNRTDVAFHAQRAMQELSFDTFKSVKSQEIVLPPSNTMMLPHDYVNYTKISWSDAAGIKHPLYPTSKTSNPFKILQEDDGGYDFTLNVSTIFENGGFDDPGDWIDNTGQWKKSSNHGVHQGTNLGVPENDPFQGATNGRYEWKHVARSMSGGLLTRHYALWQTVDVSEVDIITLSAKGLSGIAKTGKTKGIVRIGFSTRIDLATQDPLATTPLSAYNVDGYNPTKTNPRASANVQAQVIQKSKNMDPDVFDIANADGVSYIEFDAGDGIMSADTTLEDIDVSNLTTIDLLVVSGGGDITSGATLHPTANATFGINAIDDIVLSFEANTANLQSGGESTTWSSYKSATPSENQDSYDDNYYSGAAGERYGLDPQHAQVNGSYYIDNLRGLINFSSNVSGKTVILDYISDSLGTDGEMQVHKFAEEAMYKWIMYAVLSTKANTPEYIVRRYQKEKFAATRTAKLRLSNIKLEELTQILRGKSKWIKH